MRPAAVCLLLTELHVELSLAGPPLQAVGVIGNLVHSSAPIKRRVLEEGALQPVINLLSSTCTDSQREAALLLGQFATGEGPAAARGPPGMWVPHEHLWQLGLLPQGEAVLAADRQLLYQ